MEKGTLLRVQLQEIMERVDQGRPAALRFDADGITYVRNFRPQERLILLGGGHISQPLCQYGADLGFAVTVVDDRPSFASHPRFPEAQTVICDTFSNALRAIKIRETDHVAVITRGHRYDADCLRIILTGIFPHYLGMIGSKRRVTELFRLLEQEGFARSALDQIHAPIGLPIRALTTKEIAISILAELILCRRQESLDGTRKTALVTEDVDTSLLDFLSHEQTALLIVYETNGSTPVKTGAMMAVRRDLQTAGTIGGGCSEHAVLMEAQRLIGTGKQKSVTVDMSNDLAEEEGMVCGGQMKVLIADIKGS